MAKGMPEANLPERRPIGGKQVYPVLAGAHRRFH
jgi:hypothetical protein